LKRSCGRAYFLFFFFAGTAAGLDRAFGLADLPGASRTLSAPTGFAAGFGLAGSAAAAGLGAAFVTSVKRV
jgi:hypothetical protein